MKSIELTEADKSLGEYARQLGSEPLVLTESGRAVAALRPVDQDDIDSLSLASNPEFVAILE